jgi:AraC-like DNA-binding protein
MLRFQETAPPEALCPFVHASWSFDAGAGAPPVHHVPPDGCVSIVLGADHAVLVGPRMTDLAVPVRAGASFRGVRMRPEAAGLLVRITPAEWVGRVSPLVDADPDLAGAAASSDVDEALVLLLTALERRAGSVDVPDALVRDALCAIDMGDFRVESLASGLGVSTRTMQRRFVAATGLSPKAFVRIRRFRLAVGTLLAPGPRPWGRIAAEGGFADQAHLVREVTALAGAPPSAVQARVRRIAHIDVRP